MSALSERTTEGPVPTPENPTTINVGYDEHVLSRAAVWHEDDVYVIRSLEYDVIAADADLGAAIENFVRNSATYAQLLGSDDDATHDDRELALTIFSRMTAIASALGTLQVPERRGLIPSWAHRPSRRQPAHGWHLLAAS